MVSPGKTRLSGNGFMHLNRSVGILLTQASYYVVAHFDLIAKYLSGKDKCNNATYSTNPKKNSTVIVRKSIERIEEA